MDGYNRRANMKLIDIMDKLGQPLPDGFLLFM
jgi:hypothetical protein